MLREKKEEVDRKRTLNLIDHGYQPENEVNWKELEYGYITDKKTLQN